MNILHTRHRQRGVSAWTLTGSLLVVAGLVGLGIALIKPGSQTSGIASVATKSGADNAATAGIKSAGPGAAAAPVAKSDPSRGPHPNWHGTWRSVAPDAQMVITPTEVGGCKWINAAEPRFNSDCESGYEKASVALADISRRFEESLVEFQRDPSHFSISDLTQSRRFISRIKPGNYRVIWRHDGSDCGLEQMIADGDLMLRIVDCKYRHQISLFTRERTIPSPVGQVPQVSAGVTVAPSLPVGRWQGTVSQLGYSPYSAVMQLQSNSTGVPVGTMAYPSMPCTASLTFTRTVGNVFWFRESVQEGRGKCVDGGQISISAMSDGTMAWQYFVPVNLNSPVATGTFRR